MKEVIIAILERMNDNPQVNIVLLALTILIWYINYIRLTPLEKKLQTNLEKIFRKIVNAILCMFFILFLFLQKVYRLTKEENSSYNIDLFFREVSKLYIYLIIFLILTVLIVTLFEFLGKPYEYYDDYIIYQNKKYYLIGSYRKNYILFKIESEEENSRGVYHDILKKKEFLEDKAFISSSQIAPIRKFKNGFNRHRLEIKSFLKGESKNWEKVLLVIFLIFGLIYMIIIIYMLFELIKLLVLI